MKEIQYNKAINEALLEEFERDEKVFMTRARRQVRQGQGHGHANL